MINTKDICLANGSYSILGDNGEPVWSVAIKNPKPIARIKICGGGLTFTITDNMQFEMPTEEQCENLKKTFGIEVELIDE